MSFFFNFFILFLSLRYSFLESFEQIFLLKDSPFFSHLIFSFKFLTSGSFSVTTWGGSSFLSSTSISSSSTLSTIMSSFFWSSSLSSSEIWSTVGSTNDCWCFTNFSNFSRRNSCLHLRFFKSLTLSDNSLKFWLEIISSSESCEKTVCEAVSTTTTGVTSTVSSESSRSSRHPWYSLSWLRSSSSDLKSSSHWEQSKATTGTTLSTVFFLTVFLHFFLSFVFLTGGVLVWALSLCFCRSSRDLNLIEHSSHWWM